MPEPSAEWLAEHDRYLASSAWGERRAAVLQRDKFQCQARLERCTQKAVQVHHVTYRHWRNEPLFDLVSVCWFCHEEITRMERGDLAAIVAEKDSAHEHFQRMWDTAMTKRLEKSRRSTIPPEVAAELEHMANNRPTPEQIAAELERLSQNHAP